MIRLIVGCIGAIYISSTSAQAQSMPKAFACEFANGYFSSFERTWSTKSDPSRLSMTFASIDIQNSKAQMIGNAGASDVYLMAGENVLNFLEITPVGNQILTSVFYKNQSGKDFPAVHSRHIALFENLSFHNFLVFVLQDTDTHSKSDAMTPSPSLSKRRAQRHRDQSFSSASIRLTTASSSGSFTVAISHIAAGSTR